MIRARSLFLPGGDVLLEFLPLDQAHVGFLRCFLEGWPWVPCPKSGAEGNAWDLLKDLLDTVLDGCLWDPMLEEEVACHILVCVPFGSSEDDEVTWTGLEECQEEAGPEGQDEVGQVMVSCALLEVDLEVSASGNEELGRWGRKGLKQLVHGRDGLRSNARNAVLSVEDDPSAGMSAGGDRDLGEAVASLCGMQVRLKEDGELAGDAVRSTQEGKCPSRGAVVGFDSDPMGLMVDQDEVVI